MRSSRSAPGLPIALLMGLALLIAGACETTRITQCPKGFVPSGNDCLPVDGGLDGATDATVDAGPCNGACTGDTPLCLEDGGTCVGCLADEDCTDPEASRCEPTTHTCAPCSLNVDCVGIADGRDKCDTSQTPAVCYGCDSATEFTDCDGTFCDGATRTCTSTAVGDKATCVACTADTDCVANHRCVPMTFGEPAEAHGSYCLELIPDDGCQRPYETVIEAESVSGEEAADYCGIAQTLTTCEAVRTLMADEPVVCAKDESCTALGSLCRILRGGDQTCTYACTTVEECPAGGRGAGCGLGKKPLQGDEEFCGG